MFHHILHYNQTHLHIYFRLCILYNVLFYLRYYILNLLKIDNIDYPEKGDLKEYYEFTYKTKPNGEIIEYERILQFDHTGKVIKVLSESQKKILEEKEFIKSNKESAKSIYNGIVGELFEDLLKTN